MLILLHPLAAYYSIYFTGNLQQFLFRFQKVLRFFRYLRVDLGVLTHLVVERNQGVADC